MKVTQIVTTYGQNCGIAVFGEAVRGEMERVGIEVVTRVGVIDEEIDSDLVLVQYNSESMEAEQVRSICKLVSKPVVLFAHTPDVAEFEQLVDGYCAMCPGMLPETEIAHLVFPNPIWTPSRLSDRRELKRSLSFPEDMPVVGTNGFLKFEREFDKILEMLLPRAVEHNWFIYLLTSPWHIDSPGLLEKLADIAARYGKHFRHEHVYLTEEDLNLRLQTCDLLWCWSRTKSSPYASGVITHQYASGTRIVAVEKTQHHHVLALPNVVKGPEDLKGFVRQIEAEVKSKNFSRHDPAPISWDVIRERFSKFLLQFKGTRPRRFY